jgi:class 3 adenylate cyclase
MSREFPAVRYAEAADGVFIAYEVRGEGPMDLVRVPGTMTSLVASFLDPVVGEHYDHLARFSRLIRLDKRGTGLSDPPVEGGAPLLEQQVEDVLAVMDQVGSQRAALYAGADGGPVAILFAAMYPHRVSALVLNSSWARRFGGPRDSKQPPSAADRDAVVQALRASWGDLEAPFALEIIAPSRRNEPGFAQLLARVQQVSASKATVASSWVADVDVTDLLPLVNTPTIVLGAANEDPINGLVHALVLAERMPNARFVAYPGADIYFGVHTPEIGALIEEFLTGARPVQASDRVLTTVMFTDIVASTERLAELGDRRWRTQLDRHDTLVREQLVAFRGREISTAGDSFFATFDGPNRAIQCAQAVIEKARTIGIDVRAGVHTGECETRGDDLGGIAVHIGARVSALAGAGEVFTTSTVKDLVAGSGIVFTDLGLHELKGIPGPRHVYQVS